MLISDTLVIDGAAMEADTPHGQYLMGTWEPSNPYWVEPFEAHRQTSFSYEAFLAAIAGLWEVEAEAPTPWIKGRRNLVLRRVLPQAVQKRDLGPAEHFTKAEGKQPSGVYRVADGIFKSTPRISELLVYDTVSKVMGWDGMLRSVVYDGDTFAGFIVTDYGDEWPDVGEASVSEHLFLGLLTWSLPLGLFPADLARENIRITEDGPVWIDIDMYPLERVRTRRALWMMSNLYKEYEPLPDYVRDASRGLRSIGSAGALSRR
jgi:hypothetical protein